MEETFSASRFQQFISTLKIKSPIIREMLAESLGVFILTTFGNGAVAQSVLSNTKNGGFISINWAFGIGVAMAIYVAEGVSGAHLNPAMSVVFSLMGKIPLWKLPLYILAQIFGGFVSGAAVFSAYYDAINAFDNGTRTVIGPTATAGIFSTYPSSYLSISNGLWDQVLGTALLSGLILTVTDKKKPKIIDGLTPLLIGFIVFVIGLSYGLNSGYAINPARDIGPRLFTYAVGYGPEVFTCYDYWFWVPIIGPTIGAVLGALIYQLAVGIHLTETQTTEAAESTKF